MNVVVSPVLNPQREIELRARPGPAIAEESWAAFGGERRVNRPETQRHLGRILSSARADARETVAIEVDGGGLPHARRAQSQPAPTQRMSPETPEAVE